MGYRVEGSQTPIPSGGFFTRPPTPSHGENKVLFHPCNVGTAPVVGRAKKHLFWKVNVHMAIIGAFSVPKTTPQNIRVRKKCPRRSYGPLKMGATRPYIWKWKFWTTCMCDIWLERSWREEQTLKMNLCSKINFKVSKVEMKFVIPLLNMPLALTKIWYNIKYPRNNGFIEMYKYWWNQGAYNMGLGVESQH